MVSDVSWSGSRLVVTSHFKFKADFTVSMIFGLTSLTEQAVNMRVDKAKTNSTFLMKFLTLNCVGNHNSNRLFSLALRVQQEVAHYL